MGQFSAQKFTPRPSREGPNWRKISHSLHPDNL